MAPSGWNFLECCKAQLTLDTVLVCGQSFRWKQNTCGEWLGVLSGHVWRLKQTQDKIFYQVYGPESSTQHPSTESMIDPEDRKTIPETRKPRKTTKRKASHYASASQPESTCVVKQEESKNVSATSQCNNALRGAHEIVVKDEINDSTGISSNSVTRTKRLTKKKGISCTPDQKSNNSSNNDQIPQIKLENDGDANVSKLKDQNIKNQAGDFNGSAAISNITRPAKDDRFSNILWDYFQLDVDLEKMYHLWSVQDPHFASVSHKFPGIRMLRQDPVENLLSFVCSSNNHISRISSMVEKLCQHYGDFITTVDGEPYHSFPSLSALCGENVDSHLRELSFGYRAKFISSIARLVTHERGGDNWVRQLRNKSYHEAKKELMSLMGVGAKVADCVCLMSLDQAGAVPVDTHVWQITRSHYMQARLSTAKSLTDSIYNEIGNFFRDLWGPYAGWAHSVLFTADLRQNKEKADLVKKEAKQSKTKNKKSETALQSLEIKPVKVKKRE